MATVYLINLDYLPCCGLLFFSISSSKDRVGTSWLVYIGRFVIDDFAVMCIDR